MSKKKKKKKKNLLGLNFSVLLIPPKTVSFNDTAKYIIAKNSDVSKFSPTYYFFPINHCMNSSGNFSDFSL